MFDSWAADHCRAGAAVMQGVEQDFDHTVVRAPVGGVVGNRQVRIGRFVTPGVSLLDTVPVNDVWVVATFKETLISATLFCFT
jgi:multidrug resistance efflux pump